MRLQFAVLLAVATFLASVTAAVDSKAAVTPAMVGNGVPATRLLRAGITTEEDDEERGLPLPGLESVATLSRTNSQKQLDELLESGLGSFNSFHFLHLDNAGENILGSPALKVWMKYVKRVENRNKNNPTTVVLAKLRAHFGSSADLAEALQKATLVKSTEKTASKLQTAQFEQWFANNWRTADVVDNVFKYDDAAWRALDVRSAPRQVRKSYSEYLKANHPDFV